MTVEPIRTLGVDLASQPAKTGMCRLRWKEGGAFIEELERPATDVRILALRGSHTPLGIDAPFGWPLAFRRLMNERPAATAVRDDWYQTSMDGLLYRITDRFVYDRTGKKPLTVAADWIAYAAMRCAGLLSSMGVADFSGTHGVYEVYPAAALIRWKVFDGPKDKLPLPDTVERLITACGFGVEPAKKIMEMKRDEHLFDAFVAALIARAADLGLTEPPSVFLEVARTEGWIHLPAPNSLELLASPV